MTGCQLLQGGGKPGIGIDLAHAARLHERADNRPGGGAHFTTGKPSVLREHSFDDMSQLFERVLPTLLLVSLPL